MYLGVSSPIVEVFVQGSVPRDVRLLAARGMAASVGCDRLALLALMTLDEDPEVSALALATIDAIPRQALSAFFGRGDVPQELRAWFETGRAPAPPTSESAGVPERVASAHPPAEGRETPFSAGSSADLPAIADDPLPDDEDEAHQLLTSLPVPDKIKLATLGRREQRAILVRDPNRIVSTAVLSSPKLTDTEVENFARMQNVSDEVLRLIGTSRCVDQELYGGVGAGEEPADADGSVDAAAHAPGRAGPQGPGGGPQRARERPAGCAQTARRSAVAQVLTATAAWAASTSGYPLPGCRLPVADSRLPIPGSRFPASRPSRRRPTRGASPRCPSMNTAARSRSSSLVNCLKRSIAVSKSSPIEALVTLK